VDGVIPATADHHALGTIGAVCAIIALIGPEPLDEWPSGYVWVPVLGAFLVIAAGPEQWINRRVLATRPMVFIGLISYPLYLWHWSLFMIVAIAHGHTSTLGFRQVSVTWKFAVIAACLVLSHLTYRYVELPLRSSRNSRDVALLLCVAMIVCSVVAYSFLR
jgi:peptidoglycan/LPS O-acetylase OafA/YrhL